MQNTLYSIVGMTINKSHWRERERERETHTHTHTHTHTYIYIYIYLCYANVLRYTMLKTMLWMHQPPISHNKFYVLVVNNICEFYTWQGCSKSNTLHSKSTKLFTSVTRLA